MTLTLDALYTWILLVFSKRLYVQNIYKMAVYHIRSVEVGNEGQGRGFADEPSASVVSELQQTTKALQTQYNTY